MPETRDLYDHVKGIEEQLKRLNATMDRIEPFLAASRTKNAPTAPQEAQEPREDLKPVVREGDEEFSALSARMFEALEIAHHGQIEGHFACECGRNAGECLRWDRICKSGDTLMALRPRYDDYRAQQRDHDATDREDAER